MTPIPGGHKVLLRNGAVLTKCTPLSSDKRRQKSWEMWCGTLLVKGKSGWVVGRRYIFRVSDKEIKRVFKHPAPEPLPDPKATWSKKRTS